MYKLSLFNIYTHRAHDLLSSVRTRTFVRLIYKASIRKTNIYDELNAMINGNLITINKSNFLVVSNEARGWKTIVLRA